MKRKIFIGSSKEGHLVAKKIEEQLNNKLGDWIKCETWKDGDVFSSNKSTLECLVKASRKYDYGILVASNDDITFKRWKLNKSMRDNVLFEMGLFLGSLGLQRAYLMTHDRIVLPTDYNGITVIKYNQNNLEDNIQLIIKEIEKTKTSFNLKPMPSAALALGYFESFVLPFSERIFKDDPNFHLNIITPENIENIDLLIEKHKQNNPSIKKYEDRPTAFQYISNLQEYWDIPTTLKTLKTLIDYFIPSNEIGIDVEKEEWIKHELRNFKGTVEMLIKKHNIFKEQINIYFI